MNITRNTWMLVALIFVGSLAVSLLYLYVSFIKSTAEPISSNTRAQDHHSPGILSLSSQAQNTQFEAGQDVYIMMQGDSSGIPIAGYDGIITYDPDKLTFIEAENSMNSYTLFTSKKEGSVMLTGSLASLNSAAPILTAANLAQLHFVAKQAGDSSSIALVFIPGSKTDSNLLSEKTQDILGSVKNIGEDGGEYVPDQIIVAYRKNQDPQYLENSVQERGLKRQSPLSALAMQLEDVKMRLSYVNTPEEMLQNIQRADKTSGVIKKEFLSFDQTDGSNSYILTLNQAVSVKEAVMIMSGLKEVLYAQPNYLFQAY